MFFVPNYFKSSFLNKSALDELIPDSFKEILNTDDLTNKLNFDGNVGLNLKHGEFKYLREIKLPKNIKWESGDFKFKTLGSSI